MSAWKSRNGHDTIQCVGGALYSSTVSAGLQLAIKERTSNSASPLMCFTGEAAMMRIDLERFWNRPQQIEKLSGFKCKILSIVLVPSCESHSSQSTEYCTFIVCYWAGPGQLRFEGVVANTKSWQTSLFRVRPYWPVFWFLIATFRC